MKRSTSRRQQIAWFIALLLGVSLAGCQTTGTGAGGSGTSAAQRLAEQGRHDEAAAEFIARATTVEGAARDRLTLLAAEQWVLAGDAARARNALNSVAQPVSEALTPLASIVQSGILVMDGRADDALAILEPLSRNPLNVEDRLRVDAARADAWLALEEPARAIELMTQREALLDDRNEILNNRERLWRGLTSTHPMVLRENSELTMDPEVRGWLTLASLARTTGEQGIGWDSGLRRWQEANPRHPAILLFDEDDLSSQPVLDYPRNVALLLPLSGRTANAGMAIQNGFMGAYFATAGALDDRQSIRVYDVNEEGGAVSAYETAVAEGAEFVVGPLLKSQAAELASSRLLPVPVLALNTVDDSVNAPAGLFQFALAPEDEARTAADRAIADGHTRAVALVPSSNWGRRVLRAFVEQFELRGGTVLDYRNYTPGIADYSGTIESLMALSGSVRRYDRLRANLGVPLQFDPRRREDVDVIFLGADAPSGRLLKSQLKFHYSGDIPVYATSSVHAMDGRSNSDLNGVQFAEVPWVIRSEGFSSYLPDAFEETWPEQRPLSRLHAMGFDAYQLIAPLHGSMGGGVVSMDGATGRLRLGSDGRIYRELAWAAFRSGNAVPVRPAVPDLGDDEDLDTEASWQDERLEL